MRIYLKSIKNNFKLSFKFAILSSIDLIYDEYIGEIYLDESHFGYNGNIPLIVENIHGSDILNYIIYYESKDLNIILSICGIKCNIELSLKLNDNDVFSNLRVKNEDKICEIKFLTNPVILIDNKREEYYITSFPSIIEPNMSINHLTIQDSNNKLIDYYLI